MRTAKISIAIDKTSLARARAAAKSRGLSLSAFIGKALDVELDDQDRLDAARRLWASWGPESTPTDDDREALQRHMARPKKRRARAA